MDNTASTCINGEGVRKLQELSGKTAAEDYFVVDFASLLAEPQQQQQQQKSEPKRKAKPGKMDHVAKLDDGTTGDQCCEKGVESLKIE